jgi:protein-S-isoprenylcysteine O-methyltransferase Ste14
MANTDTANVIIRPPIAWAVAVLAGLALDRLVPLPFVPAAVPAGWVGAMVFALALALLAWAIATITRAGSNVPTNRPTTTIVETGPYRVTRNPIYLSMMLGLIGLAIALNSLWLLLTLVPFALVIRYGVIAREEAYLERKFGDVYGRYRARGAGCNASRQTSRCRQDASEGRSWVLVIGSCDLCYRAATSRRRRLHSKRAVLAIGGISCSK